MKGRYQLGFVLMLFCCLAQQTKAQSQKSLPTGNLEEQFNYLKEESGPYKNYKVVPQTWLDTFWANANDTLTAQEEALQKRQETINGQNEEIETFRAEKAALHDKISSLEDEKNSLIFLGVTIRKPIYHVLVWAIIAGLAAGLTFFFGRFRYAHAVTRKTRLENQELQEKTAQLRRRMLEKEQELRRQLQDEINKRLG